MTFLLIAVLALIMVSLVRGSSKGGVKPCRKCKGQKVVPSRRWFHKKCLDRCRRCDGTGKELTLLTRILDGKARRKARRRRKGARGGLMGFLLGRGRR
jgi:DnaJ-class molecular chaperone